MSEIKLKPKGVDGVEVFCPLTLKEEEVNNHCRKLDGTKCGYYEGSTHDYVNNRLILKCGHPDIVSCNPESEIDL